MPPVAGITPRRTAWTASIYSICLKIAANRQVIVALGKSIPASETTMPQVPRSFFPIKTVNATRLMPGVRTHKFQRYINSSIDSHLCFSINARCIKNVVDAPPPKDCSPMLAQMRKSCHLPGLGSCSLIQSALCGVVVLVLLVGTTTSHLQGQRKNCGSAHQEYERHENMCRQTVSSCQERYLPAAIHPKFSQGLVDGVGWVNQRFSCHLHT